MENIHVREAHARGNATHRGDFTEAMARHDSEVAGVAGHRRDATRVAQGWCRKQAAKWREAHEREEQLSELRWSFREPEIRQRFQLRQGDGSQLPPTPVDPQVDKDERMAATMTRRESLGNAGAMTLLKDSLLKPKRPREERLRTLRHYSRQRWREARDARRAAAEDPASGGDGEGDDSAASSPRASEMKASHTKSSKMGDTTRVDHRPSTGMHRTSTTFGMVAMQHWSSPTISDRDVLEEVFAQAGRGLNGVVDHTEAAASLQDLGLRPRTQAERDEVTGILQGFGRPTFDFGAFREAVVPQVRAAIADLRRPALLEMHKELDAKSPRGSVEDARPGVPVDVILEIFRKQGTPVSNAVLEHAVTVYLEVASVEEPDTPRDLKVDALGFPAFVVVLQELVGRERASRFRRIASSLELGEEEVGFWRRNLLEVHEMFHIYDPSAAKWGSPSGRLNKEQVVVVLRESGYMPKQASEREAVEASLSELLDEKGLCRFGGFVALMRELLELDFARLKRVVDHRLHATGRSGLQGVRVHELGGFLGDCGIAPQTPDERAEIPAIIEDCHRQRGEDVFTRDEVVFLCQRIATRFRAMQRDRERLFAASAGWSEERFAEFRSVFQTFDEDASEVLERDELTKAVELLKGHYVQNQGSMDSMLQSVGVDPKGDVEVDFLTFLHMLKMLDDTSARRTLGESLGFSRDQTDTIYAAYRSLEPHNSGTIKHTIVEKALLQLTEPRLSKVRFAEFQRLLAAEPARVEFGGFLSLAKFLEPLMKKDDVFQEFLDELLAWRESPEGRAATEEPKVLPTTYSL